MSYQTSVGLAESKLSAWLKNAAKKYGTFADGRVDYTNAPIAPTVMCTLKCGEEIFLGKRGYGLADAEGVWSTINGFIDEDKPVANIAANEFSEELGLNIDPRNIQVGGSLKMKSSEEKRTYFVFPCLVIVDEKPKVKLDREHTEYAWIKRSELDNYEILDGLAEVIDRAVYDAKNLDTGYTRKTEITLADIPRVLVDRQQYSPRLLNFFTTPSWQPMKQLV